MKYYFRSRRLVCILRHIWNSIKKITIDHNQSITDETPGRSDVNLRDKRNSSVQHVQDDRISNMQRSFTLLPDTSLFNNLSNDAVAIWLDDTVGSCMENRELCVVEQLRQIISHIEIFKNIYEYNNYVYSTEIKRIFLIVAGTFADNFDIDLFAKPRENLLIYVFTTTKIEFQETYENIRGYFKNTPTLLNKIQNDYTTFDADSFSLNTTETTTRFVNPELVQWKCLQLTMDLFRRMPCAYEETKKKFLEFCRSYYADNTTELRYIDEFENNYEKDKAIYWYSRPCFLSQILNSNMRINNIDAVMTFSFYMNNLCDHLNQLRCIESSTTSGLFMVYRGSLMQFDELQHLQNNIGGFISNNTLLSTSYESTVAKLYCGDNYRETDPVSVLIEISIENSLSFSKSFARIDSLSMYPDEGEVVLANGHIFRIDSCERSYGNIWLLKLTLCDDCHPIMEGASDYFDIAMLQLIEILPKISPKTNKANDRMLELWRFYSENDPMELAKVDQFEKTYRSDEAVRWYTKDSILYRLLNAALRQENIDKIIDFRYFIIDLYDQLAISHMNYVRNFTEPNFNVYRGQKLSLSELKKLENGIGKYISIKSFFSASKFEDVALLYAELNEFERQHNLQSVLCKINIDMEKLAKSTKNRIFANIMNLSYFIDEEEVLFMANTQFRIKSVVNPKDQFWVIELTLLNQDDENDHYLKIMNQYFDYFIKMLNEDKTDNVLSFFKEQLFKRSRPFHFIR